MNIEAYNLDSLRKLVRKPEKENQNLKQKLNEANIPYNSENIFAEASKENAKYDLDQGGRTIERYITENMAKWYFSMFWGRSKLSILTLPTKDDKITPLLNNSVILR